MKMFKLEEQKLKDLGAIITTNEIKQQPELWLETYEIYKSNKEKLSRFIDTISNNHGQFRVIFTGAGTSAYIGNSILPYLKNKNDIRKYIFEAIPTTDIVSNPYDYLKKDIPTLLISFARSGNSPESLAALNLGNKIVDNFYHLAITCNPEGELAKMTKNDENNYLLLMPSKSNDEGFAMTGSFSCMMLSAMLIFDSLEDDVEKSYINAIIEMGRNVIDRKDEIHELINKDFDRVVYLGSGGLGSLTQEAQLKLLELTAGKISTVYDSPMGFRHGPKSFIDENTLVFEFVSNCLYTRKYDLDVLEEIKRDKIAKFTCVVSVENENNFSGTKFEFKEKYNKLPDVYLAMPYILFAQTIALFVSVKVGNKPDTPSATGTVNRVVKGVTIYEY
ncbi:SIS domain-containing protein [Clostridioides difficile]|nr:SIS domain protein [Clostridioides difficile CD42]EQH53563.1 SIS domain protein [Clostridioides difficile DA00261]EQH59810.1 SIS domain protein [Clostridioides difficile DA00275]EQI39369.1 SIS domain protein [Clostridioides difficile Y231]EQI63915.1 SIS domain protein [Clostridioides difficile Y358]EQJ32060.1 SIS domain protein [Clostridioides difficile P20]MBH7633514.1 SIS domain-containing protein [Clostridioides difficile]